MLIMSMRVSPPSMTGRVRQKERTRNALLAATRVLLAKGVLPTVEQAAEHAGVSRATAYRYFVNQRALLSAVHPEVVRDSLLPPGPPADPVERVRIVATEVMRIVVENQAELRASLRLALGSHDEAEQPPPMRRGRRYGWFLDALQTDELRLSRQLRRRLALQLAATVGIEPMIWLTDMGEVPAKDAAQMLIANAEAVIRDALTARRPPRQ